MSRQKQIGYIGERRVAEFLNLKRTGALGIQIYDLHSDDSLLKVEVKAGKQIPKLVSTAFAQVLPHITENSNELPVVVMVPKGVGEKTIGTDAYAILQLKDFKHLVEGGYGNPSPTKVTIELDTGEIFEFNKD